MSNASEPVVYPLNEADDFVRMLLVLTRLTDLKPAATFADERVLAAGEDLCRCLQERAREAAKANDKKDPGDQAPARSDL